LCIASLGCSASDSSTVSRGNIYEVGLSLKQSKPDIERSLGIILNLLIKVADRGDIVTIIDAERIETIASFDFSKANKIHNSKLKAKFIQKGWMQILAYVKGHQTEIGENNFIPAFARYLSNRRQELSGRMKVLLLGSPIYQDSDPLFGGMREGFLPHIVFSLSDSHFRTIGKENSLQDIDVHFIFNREAFLNDYHRSEVEKFWGIYFQTQSAKLLTFSSNSKSYKRLTLNHLEAKVYELNLNDTKLEIHSAERIPSNILGRVVSTNPPPPTKYVGKGIEIGFILEDEKNDVDQYIKFKKGEELYFKRHKTTGADFPAYWKKDRKSKNELVKVPPSIDVDIRDVEVWLNYYGNYSKGASGSPKGEVRVLFNNKLYSAPFQIPASKGDKGESDRQSASTWIKIDLEQVVGLM